MFGLKLDDCKFRTSKEGEKCYNEHCVKSVGSVGGVVEMYLESRNVLGEYF